MAGIDDNLLIDMEINVKKAMEGLESIGEQMEKIGTDSSKAFKGAEKGLKDVGKAGQKAGDNVDDGANDGEKGLEQLKKKAQEVSEKMQSSFKKVGGILAQVGKAAIAAGAVVGGLGIKYNMEMEQAAVAFETLLGSSEKSKKMIEELQEFGANTPFEFTGLQESAKQMLAMGIESENILPYMKDLGNAVAILGGGEEKLNSVAQAIGKMGANGTLSAEEMNMLTDAGIASWSILGEKMGLSVGELKKMAEQGKIMSKDVIPLLVSGIGEEFAGGLEKGSQTVNGMFSNLIDNANILMGELSKPVFEYMRKVLPKIVERVTQMTQAFKDNGMEGLLEEIFPKNVVKTIMDITKASKDFGNFIVDNWGKIEPILAGIVAGFIAFKTLSFVSGLMAAISAAGGVLTVVMTGLTAVTGAFAGVLAVLTSPITLIAAAIAGLVAIGWYLWKNWDQVTAFLKKTWEKVSAFLKPHLETLKKFLLDLWESISSFLIKSWESTKKFFTDTWNKIYGFIKPLLEGIMKFYTTIFNIMKKVFITTWKNVFAYAKFIFSAIKTYITAVWEGIKLVFGTALSIIVAIFTGQFDKIDDLLKKAMQMAKDLIFKTWDKISSIFKIFLGDIFSNVRDYFEFMKEAITEKLGSAFSNIIKFIGNVISKLSEWRDNIIELSVKAFKGLVGAITDKASDISTAVGDIIDSIIGFFEDLPGDIKEAGKDTIQGFIDGIQSMGRTLSRKMTAFVSENIPGPLKKVLGIASPSKLFKQFGSWTMEGYGDGIDSQERNIVKTMENMANKTVEPMKDISKRASDLIGNIKGEGNIDVGVNMTGLDSAIEKANMTAKANLKTKQEVRVVNEVHLHGDLQEAFSTKVGKQIIDDALGSFGGDFSG